MVKQSIESFRQLCSSGLSQPSDVLGGRKRAAGVSRSASDLLKCCWYNMKLLAVMMLHDAVWLVMLGLSEVGEHRVDELEGLVDLLADFGAGEDDLAL